MLDRNIGDIVDVEVIEGNPTDIFKEVIATYVLRTEFSSEDKTLVKFYF